MKRVLLAGLAIPVIAYYCMSPVKAESKPEPLDPVVWNREANLGTAGVIGSAEYSEVMEGVYQAAAKKCLSIKGVDLYFIWLGRISPSGKIVKTLVQPSTPFSRCVNGKLRGLTVKPPPPWDKPGYPVTFAWEPM